RITLNTPYVNRRPICEDVYDILGCLTDIFPLRADRALDADILTIAQDIQRDLGEIYLHDTVSGVEIARALARKCHVDPRPLSPITFSSHLFHNFSSDSGDDVSFFSSRPRTGAPETWMDVIVHEEYGELVLSWNYLRSRFSKEWVEVLASQYRDVLEAFCRDPRVSQPLASHLTERDLTAQRTLNGAYCEFPVALCLHRWFERSAAARDTQTALVFAEQHLSYAELNTRANRLARHLIARGVRPDSLVAICLERSIDMVVSILAVLKAGGAYVPLDPAYPIERLGFILADTGTRVLVTNSTCHTGLGAAAAEVTIVAVDGDANAIAAHDGTNPDVTVSADNLAYVIYTSGSTGRPKGVLISHRNAARLFLATENWFGFGERDVWTLFHSYAFDFSVWELWGALLYGGRLVIVAQSVTRSPDAFHRLLRDCGVTVLNQTPSAFRQLIVTDQAAGEEMRLSTLRTVIFGGEPLDVRVLRPWFDKYGDQQPRLINMYGITETTVHVTYRELRAEDAALAVSPIGMPIPDLRVYVMDGRLRLQPVGVVGEVYVGGAGVARGYLNRPELTTERFIPDHITPDTHARLYKTGDLARLTADGAVLFAGRGDAQVKIRGFRIEPGEIESALTAYPDVEDAVVVARDSGQGDKQLVAYLVTRRADTIDLIKLRRRLTETLPDHMIPAAFACVAALPLTPNGKLDVSALPAPHAARSESGHESQGPRNAVERRIAALWMRVLKLDSVAIHDRFFELGGDSLTLVHLASLLEAEFGHRPEIVQLFELPTIAGQAAFYVDDAAATPGEAVTAAETLAVILDPAERDAYKRKRVALLSATPDMLDVNLGDPCAEIPLFTQRHSQRRFAATVIPLQQFSDFLSGMRETARDNDFRYAYASGGATYSVQVYLYLRSDRVQGVNAGVYYYHPQLHRLRHVADLAELPMTIHAPANQSLARDAAFHVFLIYERAAIEPIYGERSRHFALLEAGAAAHQLELSAATHGIGLCQIGGIGFEPLREIFHLNSTQVHLHTLVGGAPSCNAENRSEEPLNVAAASSLSPIVPDVAGRHEPFPLNDIQQAYWIGQTGGFDLGNVSAHYYLEFESRTLDIDRLEAAWQSVVARHDMLRAVIRSDGRQQILEEVPAYRIVCEDLRSVDVEGAERRLLETRERMSHQVFDADHWPLFEICAHRLTDGRVRLHFSMSLLIGDVWSAQVVFRDLHAYFNNPAYTPQTLDLSFRDYVLAEAAQRDSVLHRRSHAYWAQRVRELPGAPDLPLAQSPSSVRAPRFTRIAGHLDRARWERLKSKAAARNLSPSMVLCAAFAESLATWSKNANFCINLTTFQRFPLHSQVNDIVGDFTALSLLETDCSAGGFELRARRMQEQLWRDMEHRHVSGVQVQREFGRLHGRTNGAAMPVVFTSTLIGDDGGIGGALAPEWLGEQVYGSSQTPQVYIDHQLMERSGQLVYNWDYVAEIFPESLVPDMFDAFARVLVELADHDDAWQCTWGERVLRLIPESQLQQRTRVNTTDAPLSKALLHQLFLDQARLAPQHAAVITSDRELNYSELERASLRLAARLRQFNPLPNTLVAIVMDKGWEQVAAALAIQCSGAAYLPLDPTLPRERMQYLLTHGDVRCALIQPWIEEKVDWPEGITRIIVNDDVLRDGDSPEAAGDVCVSVTPDDLAYVIFTSGSTGVPKGVMIDHRGAVNTVLDINRRFKVGPEDRVFALSSLSFDLSVYDIFGTLAAGAAIVFPDAGCAQEPEHWLERIDSAAVTIWNSVPALLNLLADHAHTSGRTLASQLRLCMLSGDWIPLGLPDAVHQLLPDARIVSLGGATEASIWSIAYPIDAIDIHWRSVPYGRPLDNQRFHVLNEALAPCPVWVPGQLYIGGAGLARGYWKDPEKTAASFITHPRTGERLYRTGDLGRYWSDGNIEFLGREDQQVKINGYRVELGEIETALLQHESVKEVVVQAVGAADRGRRLVAYVVSTDISSPCAIISLPTQRSDRQENPPICAPLGLESISHLLEELRYIEIDGQPRSLYGSAGSTYAVQTYLAIADDVGPGLTAGMYYYHPERHALLRVVPYPDHGRAGSQSFDLYCVVQLAALAPLYGERSGAYAMIEAGLITELLNGAAARQGWSMRPATVNLSTAEEFLETDNGLVMLAAMTIDTAQDES
ncbi:MAG: amino acid adenylation domain-containing protein, partial [Gammaproteobacteria bacterium]